MVRRVCELDWIDLLVDSGPREPISALFWGRHEVGVSLRGCMSKIREGRGDRQLEVKCPLPVALGRPLPGDGMLVEFASAVDAVTFAVGTRAARCLRFCETDPPCDGRFLIWKRRPSY
jgi:hypothetical protein